MLYAALTFWLLVIMLSAWGVHLLWSRMVKPRVVNAVLLPGTLVAELGHVLGLLITGNSVQNTSLMGEDDDGAPQAETPDRQKLPVVGPILVALLPLAACAGCLYLAAQTWGDSVLSELSGGAALAVPQSLPTTIAGVWDLLRASITIMESMLNAILASDLPRWETILFLYLAICLTVRMAPFEDNRRGAFGAILVAGLVIGLIATLVPSAREFIARSSWPVLSFAAGMLLFLLLLSLLVTGVVSFLRLLAGRH